MNSYFSQIVYLTKNDKYKLPFLVLVILIISLLDILGLGLIAPFISIITQQENNYLLKFQEILSYFGLVLNYYETIILISITLIVTFFFKTLSNILLNWLLLRFVHRKEINFRYELIRSYYNNKYEMMISNKSSDSIENIVNLVPQFLFYTLYPLLKIVSNLIIFFLISIFLFFSVGVMTIFLITFLCMVVFLYDRFFGAKMSKYGKKSSQSNRSIIVGIQETLSGIKEIKILEKEKFFTNKIFLSAIEYAKNKIKQTIISTSFAYIFEFLIILIICLFVIIFLITHGNDFISILPAMSILALAIFRLIPKAVTISSDIGKIRSGRYATEKVSSIYKYTPVVDTKFNEKKMSKNEKIFENLKLDNVSYKYPNTENFVFSKVNLEINKGDHIGIKGESGSGKTTIVDLIIGHLNPVQGSILFNNKLLNERNYRDFTSLVSYIPQKVFLVDDTLTKNITLSESNDIDQKKLNESIKRAKLDKLVSKLDLGMEHKVGEDGINLSGGQRQRIAIARSFFHEKQFIIFDEVTSALDAETTSQIIKEISILKDKTVIIISHDDKALENCDKIFEIKNGQLKLAS